MISLVQTMTRTRAARRRSTNHGRQPELATIRCRSSASRSAEHPGSGEATRSSRASAGLKYETEIVPVREGGATTRRSSSRRDEVVEHRAQAGLHAGSTAARVARGVADPGQKMTGIERHDHPARHRAAARQATWTVLSAAGREVGDHRVRRVARASSRSRRSRSRTTASRSARVTELERRRWRTTTEPRALTAALAAPAFVTRGAAAWRMHVAEPSRRALGARGERAAASARCATSASSIGSSRRGSRPRSARRRCACSASTSRPACRRARRRRTCRGCSRARGTRTSSTGWRRRARSHARGRASSRRRAAMLTTRGTYVAPQRRSRADRRCRRALLRVRRAVAVDRAARAGSAFGARTRTRRSFRSRRRRPRS